MKKFQLTFKPIVLWFAVIASLTLAGCGGGGEDSGSNTDLQSPAGTNTKSVTIISGKA